MSEIANVVGGGAVDGIRYFWRCVLTTYICRPFNPPEEIEVSEDKHSVIISTYDYFSHDGDISKFSVPIYETGQEIEDIKIRDIDNDGNLDIQFQQCTKLNDHSTCQTRWLDSDRIREFYREAVESKKEVVVNASYNPTW